jgi:hypothetical protein
LGKISTRLLAGSIFPKSLAFAQLEKNGCLSLSF